MKLNLAKKRNKALEDFHNKVGFLISDISFKYGSLGLANKDFVLSGLVESKKAISSQLGLSNKVLAKLRKV